MNKWNGRLTLLLILIILSAAVTAIGIFWIDDPVSKVITIVAGSLILVSSIGSFLVLRYSRSR